MHRPHPQDPCEHTGYAGAPKLRYRAGFMAPAAVAAVAAGMGCTAAVAVAVAAALTPPTVRLPPTAHQKTCGKGADLHGLGVDGLGVDGLLRWLGDRVRERSLLLQPATCQSCGSCAICSTCSRAREKEQNISLVARAARRWAVAVAVHRGCTPPRGRPAAARRRGAWLSPARVGPR